MPTYKGNKGNLLQHWVLCELVSAARRRSSHSHLQFIDAHAMAPMAQPEPKRKESVFDSVRVHLPGQGSLYEKTWRSLDQGDATYPNSANFVKRIWTGRLSMLLCEKDEETLEALRDWAGSTPDVEVASGDWRSRFKGGLPESRTLRLLSFDPYMLSCHAPTKRDRKTGCMYPEDLDLIGQELQEGTDLLIQLSTYTANGRNQQPDVDKCARDKLAPFGLERIARVAADGHMMSLVFARGLTWADELASLNTRFRRWLNIAQIDSATSA